MDQKNIKIKILIFIVAFLLASIDAACAGMFHADHMNNMPMHAALAKKITDNPENPHNQTHLATDNCCYTYCILKNAGYAGKPGYKYETSDVIITSNVFIPWALSVSGIIKLPREKIQFEEFTSFIPSRAPPFQLA